MRQASSDSVDPVRVGRENLDQWGRMLDRCIETREAHPELAERIIDLDYDDIVADPMRCVADIYERFDLELSPASESRMKEYLAAHPRDLYGVHRYEAATFGLDPDELSETFAGYRSRFGVRAEPEV
jgi:hypothetical protein